MFENDLCSWGQRLPSTGDVITTSMFLATNCPNKADPDPSNFAGSSFCYVCEAGASTTAPTNAPTLSFGSSGNRTGAPTSAPTSSSGNVAFVDAGALQDAVDKYLRDNSPTSDVALMYGYPIGSWNVSQVTDFSNVFDVLRNPLASTFDEDLSGWNTLAAEAMVRTFAGASHFNGNVSTWSTGRVSSMNAMCTFDLSIYCRVHVDTDMRLTLKLCF